MSDTYTIKLTGDSLISFVEDQSERYTNKRGELILDAGYVQANGRPNYVEFYEELLRAKGQLHTTWSEVGDEVYENLDPDAKALFDVIDENFGQKWTVEEVMEFMEELDKEGITTAEEFNDSFCYQTDDYYNAEEEFAQSVFEDMSFQPSELINFVDWQRVWDEMLRYDYSVIEFDRSAFFFRVC